MKAYGFKQWLFTAMLALFSVTSFAWGLQSQLTDTQKQIKQLCTDRYKSVGDFDAFANKLLSLGVVRQTYDVVLDELDFYSKDALVYRLPVSEIGKSRDDHSLEIGNALNVARVKKAIDNVDHNKLTALEFHNEIAHAGVVYVSVYLKQKKIYYMGQNSKYYLESY